MAKKKIDILRLLYPPKCCICERPLLRSEEDFCASCADKRPIKITGHRCFRCSKPLTDKAAEYCADCEKGHEYERGWALYEYASVRDLVLKYKNQNRRSIATFFSREIVSEYGEEIRLLCPDALLPVPLSLSKERKRGYNQAEILARQIGKALSVPVLTDVLARESGGKQQKILGVSGRRNNSKNTFILYRNDVKLNSVVIVDDVYTTGNTIDAAAQVLKEAGVKKIYFLTVAVGAPV